jgi:hypothetical protein
LTDEHEVSDEAYIAAAIKDRGFEVVRGVGSYDAEVRFTQPSAGYNNRGGVAVLTDRARDFMPYAASIAIGGTVSKEFSESVLVVEVPEHEHNRPEPADHPSAAELSPAADPGNAEARPVIHLCTTEDMDGYVAPAPSEPPKKPRKKQNRPKA